MPDMPTGQLIGLYRIDSKKSTVSVATHTGITVRYLEMIEAGAKTPSRQRNLPSKLRYARNARSMVGILVKRAKPSYASEVREFAGRIGLLILNF